MSPHQPFRLPPEDGASGRHAPSVVAERLPVNSGGEAAPGLFR